MPRVLAYHRPASVADALELLARPAAVALGGGSDLVGRLNTGQLGDVEVVDLQALGLDFHALATDGTVALGAMITLQQIVDAGVLPGALAELVRAEEPSTLRTRATLGGVVAGRDRESALLAGLLAADARVGITDASGGRVVPLADLLASGVTGAAVITEIRVSPDGDWAVSSTKRTPADVPIVAAVGRRRPDGSIALALTGVAQTPVLVGADAPTAGLTPPADFRGTSDYRLHLAGVHSSRVIDALAVSN